MVLLESYAAAVPSNSPENAIVETRRGDSASSMVGTAHVGHSLSIQVEFLNVNHHKGTVRVPALAASVPVTKCVGFLDLPMFLERIVFLQWHRSHPLWQPISNARHFQDDEIPKNDRNYQKKSQNLAVLISAMQA